MNLGTRCRFSNKCELFLGKKESSKTPLPVYRNVFCNRGIKGWKNCKEYNDRLKKDESI